MGDTQFQRLDSVPGFWFWVQDESVVLDEPTCTFLELETPCPLNDFVTAVAPNHQARFRQTLAQGGVQLVRIRAEEFRVSVSPPSPLGSIAGEIRATATERALAEESQSYHRRFQLLGDILPLGVMLLDAQGTPKYANVGLHRMMGLPEARTDAALAESMIHAEDVDEITRSFVEFMQSGALDWTERYRIVSETGDVIPVENRVVREQNAAGETIGFVSYLMDLRGESGSTAPAESLLEPRDSLAIGRVGHWSWSSDSKVLVWSDSMYEIYRLAPGEQPTIEAAERYIPNIQRQLIRREIEKSREENRGWEMEHDLVFPDGVSKRLISRGRSFQSDDGHRYTGMVIDVTSQREREQKIRQAEKLRAIGQLASGVAHDFNNMLGAIIGNATVLSEEVSPALQRPVAEIQIAAERVTQLTRQLLTFSRRQQLERGPVNVHELLDEVFTLVVHSFSPQISIKRRFGAENSVVIGDASQIQSAFLNLLVNARDALSGTAGNLEISTQNVREDGEDWIEIMFVDDGPGMDEETKRRAFEPFFTTRRESGGTGLGLSATYGAVLRHGGLIELESNLGEGTKFSIRLRLDETIDRDEPERREGPLVDGSGERVWIIDDEPLMRSLASRVLTRAKFQVATFESGEEVLESLGDDPASIMVVDHHMPGISGIELVERLRAERYDGTIVIVTGNSFDLEPGWVARMEVRSVVEKPYAVADLLSAVGPVPTT